MLRAYFVKQMSSDKKYAQMAYDERRNAIRSDFATLSPSAKTSWAEKLAAEPEFKEKDLLKRHWLLTGETHEKEEKNFMNGKHGLFTYYDSDWVFKLSAEKAKEKTIEDLTTIVQSMKQYRDVAQCAQHF